MSLLHNSIFLFLCLVVGLGVLSGLIERFLAPKRRKKRGTAKKSGNSTKKTPSSNNRKSSSRRPDDVILQTPIDQLTWTEFERLFALYFRSQGFLVEELGVGGNDGGVDLVLTNKRTKERTAVQCKHWDDKRPVGPPVIRELYTARRNPSPSCIYGMLITSSDITTGARREAEKLGITYWHGGVLDMHLSKWSQWQGKSRRRRKS